MVKEIDITAKAVSRLTERDVALDMLEREKECVRAEESGRCDGSCRGRRAIWPDWYCPSVEKAAAGGGVR